MRRSARAEPHLESRLDAELLRGWRLKVGGGADKRARHTVLVVAGATSTPGAALLAGLGAMRMGAGRLKLATSERTAVALAVAVPEARVVSLPSGDDEALRPTRDLTDAVEDTDVLVVGPGLVDAASTRDLLDAVLGAADPATVLVLDALALGAFTELGEPTRDEWRGRTIATPNREEARRLVDTEARRLVGGAGDEDVLRRVAVDTGAVVTSFGVVVEPDGRTWRSPPSIGLGTSGSGDVLAGLVGGAACRTDDLAQAACWATFAHMEAGRRAAARIGPVGYLARELLDEIPSCLPA